MKLDGVRMRCSGVRKARLARDGIDSDRCEVEHRDSVDPATGRTISKHSRGSTESGAQAVKAAVRPFGDTGRTRDRLRRIRVLNRVADAFEQPAEERVDLLAPENGKVEARGCLRTRRGASTPGLP